MAPWTRVTPGVMVDFAACEEEMKAIICSLISSVLFLFSSLRASLDESKKIYWGSPEDAVCLAEDRHTAMISRWPHAVQYMYIMSVLSNVSVHCLTDPSVERAFGCRGWLERRVWVSCPWIGFKGDHA